MVIECSSCHARFKLADDKIKTSGTKVRCTKCREVFTVFPESPLPMAAPVTAVDTVKPVVPVVTPPKKVVAGALFSGTDIPSFAAESSPPAVVDVPASEEDDWHQEAASDLFSNEFPDDAGASDLDAISFDNIEAPVFSVSNRKDGKFEFADDTAFSFTDLSLESGTEQSYKITESAAEQSLAVENDHNFEADYFSPAPVTPAPVTPAPVTPAPVTPAPVTPAPVTPAPVTPAPVTPAPVTPAPVTPAPVTPAPEDLNQLNPLASDSEFTFSRADNLTDLSWDEPGANPITTTPPEQIRDTGSTPQDTDFDFSSFSFDDVDSSARSDENISDETVSHNEATTELSMQTGTEYTPVENRLISIDVQPVPVTKDSQESTKRPARPMRPRLRQKKKGSSRLATKFIIVILLALATTYGVMNRGQIQKTYKNIVNSFIENQTRVETTGRIDLVKLSGSYVLNSREGDLFVIRGDAVNEFKGLRSSVLVKGTIFGDNGQVLQSQSAYCGNPLKDSSLKNLSFKEIRDVMSNELGENLANLDISTGKSVPFTIVFNKAPKNIKEFTVEVLESKPGSK